MSEEKKTEEKKPQERVSVRDITDETAKKDAKLRYTKRVMVDYEDEDGTKMTGEFTIVRANIEGQSRIGTIMADLREDKPAHSLDRVTFALHEAIATCRVCVTQSPPWFDPTNMYDDVVLMRVAGEALAFNNSFRKPLVK